MIAQHERPAGLDHGPRLPRSGAGPVERRPRASSSTRRDEWIMERTGIRERRIAAEDEAMSDLALPAAREALEQAGVEGERRRPDHRRDRDAGHDVSRDRRDPRRPARHRATPPPTTSRPAARASCTRSRRRTGWSRPASRERALVVGGDVLSKILDWTDRSTLVLFGDGAGAVVVERVESGGFLGLRARRRRRRGRAPVAARQRLAALRRLGAVREDERPRGVQVRDARDGALRGGDPRGVRTHGRRRRRLRAAPGERAHHRPRDEEARRSQRKRSW